MPTTTENEPKIRNTLELKAKKKKRNRTKKCLYCRRAFGKKYELM